ncbi:Tubulin-folding cofactor E [Diplonema papillatum]|nr:Tubulin-folding cofactor E [Diplonema papillatum]
MLVHDRVQHKVSNLRGTVRHVGKVDNCGDDGEFIGVEWDGVEQGKYDGEVFGKRYFTAPPKSSSFLKARNLVTGQELCQGLLAKYGLAEEHAKKVIEVGNAEKRDACVRKFEKLKSPGKSKRSGLVNVVMAKSVIRADDGSFPHLVNVMASGMAVSRIGPVSAYFPNVTDLSLADTLISRWREVFTIVTSLPSLKSLSLSGNRFEPLESSTLRDDVAATTATLSPLTVLSISNTHLPWSTVRYLASVFPALTDLNACDNGLAEPPAFREGEAAALARVRLDGNAIRDWAALRAGFAELKDLTHLHLSGNPLRVVTGEAAWPGLRALYLRSTRIDDWAAVDAMRDLEVKELCLSETPLTDGLTEHERRCLLIARIPSLETLNRGAVGRNERANCERFFVRYYHGAPDPPPIHAALVARHGELLPLAEIDMAPKLTAEVTVRYSSLEQTTAAVLNVRNTVETLKKTLCKPFSLPADKVLLTRIDPEVPNTPFASETLVHPDRMLFTYNVKDGDIIEVAVNKAHVDPALLGQNVPNDTENSEEPPKDSSGAGDNQQSSPPVATDDA